MIRVRSVSYTHLDVYKRQSMNSVIRQARSSITKRRRFGFLRSQCGTCLLYTSSLDGYPKRLAQVVAEQKKQVEKLLASADEGKMIQEGIKTVILGKPNAGKSSLLNLLAGEEKAIVTDIAGTTRDVLEENLVLKGISLRILDTAGIRKTADTVEKIGVDRALEHAKDADLILYVVDASVPLDENDAKIMEILKGRKAIRCV